MNFLETIVLTILIGGGTVYLTACLVAFVGNMKSPRKIEGFTPSVSIIVPARNEERTLGQLLQNLLAQDYPHDKIQIIVIDDCSEDKTVEIAESFISSGRIVLTGTRHSLSPYSHKKKAIHEGIMNADGEILLTIDADCSVEKGWIRGMISHFTDDINLVAGEVYIDGGGFIGQMETLEFYGIQAVASGLMNARMPITCNGANLAYRKSAYDQVGGFDDIGHIVSGDDDLLMQKIASGNPESVVFAIGTDTAVRVRAVETLKEFIVRRARWVSKTTKYPSRAATLFLSMIFTFLVALPIWLIGAVSGYFSFAPLLIIYGIKMIGDMLLAGVNAVKKGRSDLLLVFLPAEMFHVPYIIYIAFKGVLGTFEWQGRKTGAISVEEGHVTND